MNKILKWSAIALLATSTSLMAQTKQFEGIAAGIFAGGVGASVDGSVTGTATGGSGTIGKVTGIAGIDLGYGFATSSNSVISIGASYIPMKAKFGSGSGNDSTSGTSITGELKDHYTIYIQPTYVLNKDTGLFAKINYAHADVRTTNTTSASSSVEGWGAGIGSKTFVTPTTFIQVEANYAEYDTINGTKTNTGGTTRVSGDPKLLQGLITIGTTF